MLMRIMSLQKLQDQSHPLFRIILVTGTLDFQEEDFGKENIMKIKLQHFKP